ncbi:lipopolysaccharide assembly protein LapB [Pleionea litopenaei]|uniref:Lipopolysaccharide assembly protein B n=1 Tax=Pleionea litopenaei TaxID=3070815 RepID=A0AA51X6G2_9GAMM|nr:lipopolysaccharide assembly protein LapB [Pleionea sp. HL-JVS1]WMS87262.1 lipopolysaccharide assembly protein LapB [Pleionea sp. HL-JVS1]
MSDVLFYLVVLMLPIAAISGYRLGRRGRKSTSSSEGGLSRRYFVGLNYLLNEQPDKAIDTFVKMLEVDSETVETHLALGNLFRKRGEVDRAIRLHQNLIARPSLSPEVRNLSLLELGLDYMAAGLFDRAESIFKELRTEPKHKAVSLQQLMFIYQQTKDWEQAVTVAEQLQSVDHQDHAPEIAHFYCELAEKQIQQGDSKPAMVSLKRALQFDPNCIRANIIRSDIAFNQGQFKQAIKYYREMIKQNSAFVPEIIERVAATYQQLGDTKGYQSFLENSLESGESPTVVLAYAEILRKQKGDRVAADFIAQQLQQKPSLKGLLKLIEMHIEHAQPSARPSLEILFDIVNRSYQSKAAYRCLNCGFGSKALFWQCPSCKSWSSVKPVVGLEGE